MHRTDGLNPKLLLNKETFIYVDRKKLYIEIQKKRNSSVISLFGGDRKGLETMIHPEIYDPIVAHLDKIGSVKKISLYLFTLGGIISTAWAIVNLIQQFCEEFEIIIPSKAHSAGTLMCLGANNIVMTKQATIGPIDPSVNNPLNPQVPGAAPDARVPVSVEQIRGYIDLAKNEFGIEDGKDFSNVLVHLSQQIHPLVLGEVYRMQGQIRMLAEQLLKRHMDNEEDIKSIIKFFASEAGSHDYTVNRREARDEHKLPIETPDDDLYNNIKELYDDFASEMELSNPFVLNNFLGAQTSASYAFRRVFIESVEGGSNYFVSEGTVTSNTTQNPLGIQQTIATDNRTFEGWKYDSP